MMTNRQNKYLAEIERTYSVLDDSFQEALEKCGSRKEKELLTASRDAARDAFWHAVASDLCDNSAFVRSILNDLEAANDSLEESMRTLNDMKKVLDIVEKSVRLAASLAVLAAA